MKAKIRDIGFSPDSIVVGVDFYFSQGEMGYDDCWVDIYDDDGVFIETKFMPFRSVSLIFPHNVTEVTVKQAILEKLQAFKRAHAKIEVAQQFVGYEVEG